MIAMAHIKFLLLLPLLISCSSQTTSSTYSSNSSDEQISSESSSINRKEIFLKYDKIHESLYNHIVNNLNSQDIPYKYTLVKTNDINDTDILFSSTQTYDYISHLDNSLKEFVLDKVGEDYIDLFLKDDVLIGVPYSFGCCCFFINEELYPNHSNYDDLISASLNNNKNINLSIALITRNYLQSSSMFGDKLFYKEDGMFKSLLALEENNDILLKFNDYITNSPFVSHAYDIDKNDDVIGLDTSFYSFLNEEMDNMVMIKIPDIVIDDHLISNNANAAIFYATKNENSLIEDDALNLVLKAFIDDDTQRFMAIDNDCFYLPILNNVYHLEETKHEIKELDFNFSDYECYQEYSIYGEDEEEYADFTLTMSIYLSRPRDTNDLYKKALELLNNLNNL